jgi:hypothetical protein
MWHPEVKSHLTHDQTTHSLKFLGKKLNPWSTKKPDVEESSRFLDSQELRQKYIIDKERKIHHSTDEPFEEVDNNKHKKAASEASKSCCSSFLFYLKGNYHCNLVLLVQFIHTCTISQHN